MLEDGDGDPTNNREARVFTDPAELVQVFGGTDLYIEEGIVAWKVELYRDWDDDGEFSAEELSAPVASQRTSQDGGYSFEGLLPGRYRVRQEKHSVYRQTGPIGPQALDGGDEVVVTPEGTEFVVNIEWAEKFIAKKQIQLPE